MKNLKILLLIQILLFCWISSFAQQRLTKQEKNNALNHLKQSQAELMMAVKDLSETQLNFKPNEESWSIAETVEHIAVSEKNLFGIVEMSLKTDPDPSMREEVKISDQQILALINSRQQKVKTKPDLEPMNKFGSYDASLEAFKMQRASNMLFVKKTKEDLRNRYFEFPFGKVDAYQVILFMSGHTQRHMKQIVEIINNDNFPKT